MPLHRARIRTVVASLLVLALPASAGAVTTILAPGDAILGGQRVAGSFVVGVAGTAANTNNLPGAEPPEDLINGIIGGGGEKYLNFAREDTGVIVTPALGPSVVTELELWVANDAVERDPASFELWGTNAVIGGGGPFDIGALFTLITAGALLLPDTRDTTPDAVGFSQILGFANATSYSSYLLLFPTVKDAANANSMQLSEAQLYGRVPEPSLALLLGTLVAVGWAASAPRRRAAAGVSSRAER